MHENRARSNIIACLQGGCGRKTVILVLHGGESGNEIWCCMTKPCIEIESFNRCEKHGFWQIRLIEVGFVLFFTLRVTMRRIGQGC